ncbi:MAG: ribonuclease HII [Tissierellia bacterium]|nr:ribonuclease HII [Tissierellia bacterium]
MTDIKFEKDYQAQGFQKIVGIDEVGRGCLFGDVVAACVLMPLDDLIPGIRDSKKLTAKKREALYDQIRDRALAIGLGQLGPQEIDRINIKEATRQAMVQALENLRTPEGTPLEADFVLVDAESLAINLPQAALIGGDDLSYSIACASIVAKVTRDRLCQDWDQAYPGYDLAKNKGYGTKAHREALLLKGPSPYHRQTFLKKILRGAGHEK